jgi:hypothetical protein
VVEIRTEAVISGTDGIDAIVNVIKRIIKIAIMEFARLEAISYSTLKGS